MDNTISRDVWYKIYREKSIARFPWLLYGVQVQHSLIIADFLMPEAQQPIIVIILISTLLTF